MWLAMWLVLYLFDRQQCLTYLSSPVRSSSLRTVDAVPFPSVARPIFSLDDLANPCEQGPRLRVPMSG